MKGSSILPHQWQMTTLGEISSFIQYGLTATAEENIDGLFFLRISDINDYGYVSGSSPKYVPKDTPGLEKYILEPGDIVIARSGSVGRSFLYQGSDTPWVFASYLIRFRIKQEIADPEYVSWFLHSPFYGHFIDSTSRAVAQPNINSKELARLKIPLPPLLEQRRIVAILRQADELRRLRRRANQRARDLLPALFYEMFGKPDEWTDTEPISNYVDFVGGGTPSRKLDRYFEGEIPWATSKDVKSRYLYDAKEHITEEAIENSATKLVPEGTILIVVKSKILAHSLPMGITTQKFCFGQDLKGLVCKQDIPPQFIFSVVNAQADFLLQQARGVNTEGITLEMLRRLRVPKTSEDLLASFASRIGFYDEIETHQGNSDIRTEQLFNSLLARAFTGELTATWRAAHAEELHTVAAERDRLLGLAKKPEKVTVEIVGDTKALAESLRGFQSLAEQIAAGPAQAALPAFTRLAESLRPALEPLTEEVNRGLAAALSPLTGEVKQQLATALTPLAENLRAQQQQLFADLAEKIALLARQQLKEPIPRREIEARVLAVAAGRDTYVTLPDLVSDWRLNHFPRQTIQEAVDMLVVRGQLRPATLKLDTGDPERPYTLVSAYAPVRDEDRVTTDEIDL